MLTQPCCRFFLGPTSYQANNLFTETMKLIAAFQAWLAAATVLPFLLSAKAQVPGGSLHPLSIPKYIDPLVIPPVLYDDLGGTAPLDVEIAFRQFTQQVLPSTGCPAASDVLCVGNAFPKTELWGYGNPADAATFNNPSFTVEVTQNTPSKVKWSNGLVDTAGNSLPHILQDSNGVPIIDQTLHWAAPNGGCTHMHMGKTKDCHTDNPDPYTGPIPMVVHVHGAHVGPGSDGKVFVSHGRNACFHAGFERLTHFLLRCPKQATRKAGIFPMQTTSHLISKRKEHTTEVILDVLRDKVAR